MEYGEIGTAKDKGVDFLEGIDTIIVTKEKEVLNRNIFDRINWEFKILNSGILKMNEVEYKIILINF